MNESAKDETATALACEELFGIKVKIAEMLLRGVPVGISANANVFLTEDNKLYAFVFSQSNMVLGDVRKVVLRMQCEADRFLPPHGEEGYFDRIARVKFRTMFPGKNIVGEDDIRYYKSLALYNPALVKLSRVKGEIRGYDATTKIWRKVKNYNYNKISP